MSGVARYSKDEEFGSQGTDDVRTRDASSQQGADSVPEAAVNSAITRDTEGLVAAILSQQLYL